MGCRPSFLQPEVRAYGYLVLPVTLATGFLLISIWTRGNLVLARCSVAVEHVLTFYKENSLARNERTWKRDL